MTKRRRWTGLAIGDDGKVDIEWDFENRKRKTGLQVTGLYASAIETTRTESRYPEFSDYQVQVEVTLRR